MKVPGVYLSPTDLNSFMIEIWSLFLQTIQVILIHMNILESLF